tara:strand:+ start:13732 stop:15435 length:1704 start_codon:yes stop_codon:yes gene_type:complete
MNTIPVNKVISLGNVRSQKINGKNAEYKALKENIKSVGIQTPITYRKEGDKYVVINGHMRLQIAKELKMDEIPAFESNGSIDDVTKQLSTNVFTVGMSYVDMAKAIQTLNNDGVVRTKKDLATIFGKSSTVINNALAFVNLHTFIKESINDEIHLNADVMSSLRNISTNTIAAQENAMRHHLRIQKDNEWNKDSVIDEIRDYDYDDQWFSTFVEDIESYLERDEAKWEYVKDCVGEDVFRAYEKDFGIVHEYQSTLFEEYAEEQWCQDNDFLLRLFLAETEIGRFLQKNEIPVKDNINYSISDATIGFDFKNKLSSLKTKVKKKCGISLSKAEIVGFSGVFNPVLYVNIPKDDAPVINDVEETESTTAEPSDPHKLKYNKFNKWAAPIVQEHIKKNVFAMQKDENGNLIVLDWLINVREADLSLVKPYRWQDDTEPAFHPLHDVKIKNDAHLFKEMTSYWFTKHYENSSYKELDVLFTKLKIDSVHDVLMTKFLNDKEERQKYFAVLSKSELEELTGLDSKTSKDTLVEQASDVSYDNQDDPEIPYFTLVCTDKGSGINTLSNYLRK